MASKNVLPPALKMPLAGIGGWILPGLGHIIAGDHKRGVIILATILMTFWGGVAIGGVRSSVDPKRQKLWFMAQICAGGHTLLAYTWGQSERKDLADDDLVSAHWRSVELALVFTGVAGLLNVLAILDALVRSDPASHVNDPRRGPPVETT